MREIIEGNKAIAKFLTKQTGRKITTIPTRMNYNSNWNSLMGVRNEVKKLGVSVGIDDNCTVGSVAMGYSDKVTEGDNERNMVWQAMVNFVTWYNKQTSEPMGLIERAAIKTGVVLDTLAV